MPMRPAAYLAALAVIAAIVSACSQSPAEDGTPVTASASTSTSTTASPSPSTSTSPSATAAPSSSGNALPTVVVVTAPGGRRTVTKVVQVPGTGGGPQYTPGSSSALLSLYDESSSVDTNAYYSGDGLFFDSPSQNIGCYLTNDGYITCSIHHYDFPQPGPDCDRGIAATIDSTGYASLTDCSGYSPVFDRGAVLQYGESISNGSLACVSESSGVSCINLTSDTGFTLSREAFSPVS